MAIVWTEDKDGATHNLANDGIWGCVYKAHTQIVETPVNINANGSGNQNHPKIFQKWHSIYNLVLWRGFDSIPGGIMGRKMMYDLGSSSLPGFDLSATVNIQEFYVADVDKNSGLVALAYKSTNNEEGEGMGSAVIAKVFTSQIQVYCSETVVNTYTLDDQVPLDLKLIDGEKFVVIYSSNNHPTDAKIGIFAQILQCNDSSAPDMNRIGIETQITQDVFEPTISGNYSL